MDSVYRIGVFADERDVNKLTWCRHASNPREVVKKALEMTRKCGKFVIFDWHCPPEHSTLLLTVRHDDSRAARKIDNVLARLRISTQHIKEV